MINLLLLLSVGFLCIGESAIFFVTPTLPATQPCPSPCHTLDQYTQNTSLFGNYSNISLLFLEGQHNLNYDLIFDHEVNTLELKGNLTLQNISIVVIKPAVQINFENSRNVHIYGITMSSDNDVRVSLAGPVENIALMQLSINKGVVLMIIQAESAHILDNNMFSLWFVDTANIVISNTRFTGREESPAILVSSINPFLKLSLQINNCEITNHFIGLSSFVLQAMILITNTRFEGNQFAIFTFAVQEMLISNTQVVKSDGGIFIFDSQDILIQSNALSNFDLFAIYLQNTKNATIVDNTVMNSRYGIVSESSVLLVQNTIISNNTFGVVIHSPRVDVSNANINGTKVSTIQNCPFSFNTLSGLTLISLSEKVAIENCSFFENNETPIIAYQSTFELIGETVFRDNTADRGGGLALYNSTVIFGPGSNTRFINNTALEYGGAIYIASLLNIIPAIQIDFENAKHTFRGPFIIPTDLFEQKCFYSQENARAIFNGNTAMLGGFSIYGPTLYPEDCLVTNESELFIFDDSVSSSFHISSNPSRVCFCISDKPQCKDKNEISIELRRFPGEKFSVPVVLAGYKFGRVAGSVYAHTVDLDYRMVIGENQHVQTASLENCTALNFTISYPITSDIHNTIIIALTAQERFTLSMDDFNRSLENINSGACNKDPNEEYCTALQTTPIYISVTLEECPLGFKLNETTRMCDCDQTLASLRDNDGFTLTCEISNQSGNINRKGTLWIGVDAKKNSTKRYYFHRYCLRYYCNTSLTKADLKFPDTQCIQNRTGMLCGGCQENFSLRLGDNTCTQCSDNYLALLILFAALGILLVVVIGLLDFTVAYGAINGLIFYANIVWINARILFTYSSELKEPGYIVVPLSWINLDFGIGICFSQNLDQLTKTGLQFVFPVYIWCIAGLIILISHYSTRATKLFGKNSVPVLATLFLLSYGKLFRTITDVFTYAEITEASGSTNIVWTLDGNISYTKSGHAVLIVVALLFTFLFLLPFTLMLLLIPFLRGRSNKRPLNWINTFQPFFDAYFGPYKHKKFHQVWTGILLLTRVLTLVIFAITASSNPNVNVLVMTITSIFLLVYSAGVGLLYKEWHVSLLEILFLLNLGVFGGSFLFYQTRSADERQKNDPFNPVGATFVSLALLQLLVIVIIHVVRRIKPLIKSRIKNNKTEETAVEIRRRDANEMRDRDATFCIIDTNDLFDPTRYRESTLSMYNRDK